MGYLMGSRENLKLAVTVMAGGECMLPNFFFFFFCDTPSRGRTRNSTRLLLPPTTTLIKDNPTEDAVVPPHQEPQKLQVKFMTRHPRFPSPNPRPGKPQAVLRAPHLRHPWTPSPTGGFLRSCLDSYWSQSQLSFESVISFKYVRTIVPQKFQATLRHDYWVSSVLMHDGDSGGGG